LPEPPSPAVEDYLKAIYHLSASGGRASTSQIADCLDVKPASVTGMLRKLAETNPPSVAYRKHHGVTLTPYGEAVALEIIRRHRLLELFLQETLGYSWDEVHREAERLEHIISPDLAQRISMVLGDPERDPHGEPIPSQDLRLPPASELRLSELRPGEEAIVDRVDASDEDLLRRLKQTGLVPGTRIVTLEQASPEGCTLLKVEGGDDPFLLDRESCDRVFVQVI
jgi:DtxR family transcriptional regulator, Mn-dependent transcriptional regulator